MIIHVSLCGLLPPVTTSGSCPFGFPRSLDTSLQASLLQNGPLARVEQQVPSRQTLDVLQFSRSHEVSTMNGDVHRQYHTAVGPQTPCSLNCFALIGLGAPKTLVMRSPRIGMTTVRMATMVAGTRHGSRVQIYTCIQGSTDLHVGWLVHEASRRIRGHCFGSRCRSS